MLQIRNPSHVLYIDIFIFSLIDHNLKIFRLFIRRKIPRNIFRYNKLGLL